MKVKRTLTVEFDLSVKEQIEMLASLSEFENMAKENGMQVSGSFSGENVNATFEPEKPENVNPAPETEKPATPKKAPAARPAATKPAIPEAQATEEEDEQNNPPIVEDEKTEAPVVFNSNVTLEKIREKISEISEDIDNPERKEKAIALLKSYQKEDGTQVKKSSDLKESDYPAFYTALVKI